ncbi:MAG: helix-turn-helix domain-containing protein [Lachnospiraceae bacterium]|nr:helix-turn-helix domain-containing protein [Lachnospiraceae bacterium]
MELNADTLYFHLKDHYSITYLRRTDSQPGVGRPRFLTGGRISGSYLRIALDCKEILPPGTYICRNMPSLSIPEKTSVLLLEEDVSETELYNLLQEIYDSYDRWAAACVQTVEDTQDFRNLVQLTYRMLQVPVCLVDNQFTVIAQAQDPDSAHMLFGSSGHVALDTVNDLISNPHLRYLEASEGELDFEYDTDYKLFNFFYHGRYAGRLIMGIANEEYSERESLILNQLAEYVEYLLRRFGSFQNSTSTQNLLRSFLTESLTGHVPQSKTLLKISQSTGWTDQHSYMMVCFFPEHRLKKDLYPPYLISQVEELWSDSCAAEVDGNVVMIINLSINTQKKISDFYQSLAYLVRDGLMIAGCSRVFYDLRDIEIFYRQSLFSIEIGQKKDSTRWYFRFDDYALDYLISYGTGLFKPEQVCHPQLLFLQKHDQERQTSYYQTLYTYFETQFNMSHAAKKLFIHRSTFISRMERILELTGLNLNDYRTRLYLELSFQILNEPDPASVSQFYV